MRTSRHCDVHTRHCAEAQSDEDHRAPLGTRPASVQGTRVVAPVSCTLVGPGTGFGLGTGGAARENVGTVRTHVRCADPRPLRQDGQWNLPRIAQKRAVTTNVRLELLVTALNSTPVIFYPTDTSRDSNLVPVLFRVAILHASKYLLNR